MLQVDKLQQRSINQVSIFHARGCCRLTSCSTLPATLKLSPTTCPTPRPEVLLSQPAGHMTAYLSFAREQRRLLPKGLSSAEREKLLSTRWKALSKAEKSRFERAASRSAPAPLPTAPAPSFEYHPANGLPPQNLLPATPAPATVFWFGYHSSPEAICRAPLPTTAVAVPVRTLAPTACGRMDAAPALPVAPAVPVARAFAPSAPPEPLKQASLKLAPPAQRTPSAPPTTAAPVSGSAHHTLESTGLELLSTVAAVALKSTIDHN